MTEESREELSDRGRERGRKGEREREREREKERERGREREIRCKDTMSIIIAVVYSHALCELGVMFEEG